MPVAGALLLLIAVTGCERREVVRYDSPFHRFDSSDAAYRVVFPSLEMVRDEFLSLVVNTNGMEGLLDLVEATTGVDIAQEDLFEASGLDPAYPALMFEYTRGMVVCLGVEDGDRFEQFASEVAEANGFVVTRTSTVEGPVLFSTQYGLSWAFEGNLLVFVYSSEQQSEALLASLLLTPLPESPEAEVGDSISFAYRLKKGVGLEESSGSFLASMGPLSGPGHVLLRFLDSCTLLEGTAAPGDRYLLSVSAHGCGLSLTGEGTLVPEGMVPEDSILLLHWTTGTDSLYDLFSGPQKLLLNLLWSTVQKPVNKKLKKKKKKKDSTPKASEGPAPKTKAEKGTPKASEGPAPKTKADQDAAAAEKAPPELTPIGDILGRFKGELAVGLLGFSPRSTLSSVTEPGSMLDPLFALHLFLAVPVAEGAEFPEFFSEEIPVALFPGFKPREIGDDKIVGREYCRKRKEKKHCFGILRRDNLLIAVSGTGQASRIVRTLQGKGKSLDQTLFAEKVKGNLTGTLKTRRLMRDLMDMGFPPYFLQMLSSVLEVRFAASATGNSTELNLEIVLR